VLTLLTAAKVNAYAAYWVDYGRSLARLPRRREDTVMALHRGETLSPLYSQRNPFVREVLAELLTHWPQRDAAGQQLRAMAHRAGLPV
jgi:hypothetical protein